MKKILFVLLALCFVSTLAFAAETTETAVTKECPVTTGTAATESAVAPVVAATGETAAAPVVAATGETAAAPVTGETAVAAETAATGEAAVASAVIVLKGDIICNNCANLNKDTVAEFVKTHTKECALKEECAASGYSILADGKLYAFDKDSNANVTEFIQKADSKLQVVVTAKQVGEELNLVAIDNQN